MAGPRTADNGRRREPFSVVTVFNDRAVRAACLDRSIEAHRGEAPLTEYIAVDNVGGAFASAGAALNHGAARATHEYIAFVHQDVHLHSLAALEEVAGMLADDERIGMIGAIGVTHDGRFLGRVRDRVFLLGERVERPADVDSVDELLFVIPRRLLEREPLTDATDLAWHAYAVEYGLRARLRGLRVCAADIPVTHNSLTVNLDRLDVAYAAIAALHHNAMPVMTPQGMVGRPRALPKRSQLLSAHRWRYRWMRESLDAHAARRGGHRGRCLLADIRLDVDELLAALPGDPPLLVLNVDRYGTFADERSGPLQLMRRGRPVIVSSGRLDAIMATIAGTRGDAPVLVTNLARGELRALTARLPGDGRIVGFRASIGYWMLMGVEAAVMPDAWSSRRATPLGMPALHA